MLNIGDTLTLELSFGDKIEKCKCKLVERHGSRLYIDYPINIKTQKTVFLIDGTQLRCSFVVKDGNAYMFDSEVLGRSKQNIPMVVLSYPGTEQLIKIQRREYVRIETPVDIAVHPITNEFKPFVTVTDDISAGGVAIVVSNKMKVHLHMEMLTWIVLPMQNGEFQYLKFKSKVMRIIPLDDDKVKLSIQFHEVSSSDEQLLIRFCFERQLFMRKKGLLEVE